MSTDKENAMDPKEREVTILNGMLALLAALSLAVVVWTVVVSGFRAGTDDVFLVLTCLMLALIFGISPVMWAREQGWIGGSSESEEEGEVLAMELEHAHGGSNKQNIIVWGGLLFLTAIEVLLAYTQVNLHLMLGILIVLSFIKAALIVAYFMHLRFERRSLVLTIVPTLVVLFCLFAIFFPDSFRLLHNR
jgi:cytochrome c oxidase subunit IV